MSVPRAGLRRLGKLGVRALFSAAAATVFLLVGCRHSVPSEPLADWHRWQARRLESVAGTNGWASLVGLHWLPEGPSTSGARTDQMHRFPTGRAPEVMGVWHRSGSAIRLEPAPGVSVLKNGQPFNGGPLVTDAHGADPDVVSVGGLRITVIDRGGRLGLRVKDSLSPSRTRFAGLRYFPWSADWVLPARLEPAAPGATLTLATVVGTRESLPLAGTLVVEIAGKPHRLQAALDTETDDLFVLFRDLTNGRETYGAGRFLHAPKPDPAGRTTLDFNRAYNPPCAVTPFATCPMTPPGNRLPIRVLAGERQYRGTLDPHRASP